MGHEHKDEHGHTRPTYTSGMTVISSKLVHMQHLAGGLSVSIVKCTVLSCESACVNQCPALPTASAMHTVTRFLSPQIQWTWMHPGCCTDPIPIIWVPRAHRFGLFT